MRIRVLLPLLASALLAAPAFAQMPDLRPAPESRPDAREEERAQARADAWQAYGLRVARALGRSDGARDLALAVLIEATVRTQGEGGVAAADVERWRLEAVAGGAGDAITQQLLMAAGHASGDQAAAAARRWQSLSPGNLAPLMHQGLGAEEVLAAAARSSRNAPDPYPVLRWITSALARHPPGAAEWAALGDGADGPPPSAAANAAIWASSLQGLLEPDYRDVLGACTGRGLRVAGRPEACRHMADLLLARPQTVLDERIGLSMARALTRSAAERAPLDARRRGVDWRQEQLAELAAREDGDAAAAERHARLLADPAIDTEDAIVRRTLAAAGLAQEPPAAWRAPWQRPPR